MAGRRRLPDDSYDEDYGPAYGAPEEYQPPQQQDDNKGQPDFSEPPPDYSYHPTETAGGGYEPPSDTRNPNPIPDDRVTRNGTTTWGGATTPETPYGKDNPYPYSAGGKSYAQYMLELMQSGVPFAEAKYNADILFGMNGNAKTQNNPNGGANGDALDVDSIVNGWMANENPYHHADASYWINKIRSAREFSTDPQGVINYFHGRFLEDPNNNPHSPQNQTGGGLSLNEILSRFGNVGGGVNLPSLVIPNFSFNMPDLSGGQLGGDIEAALHTLLTGGNMDPRQQQMMFETARENENRAFRSMMTDAKAAMANRGTLSEPGQEVGAEANVTRRIGESLAPVFAAAARDSYLQQSRDKTQNMISGLQLGNGRQQMLADIALNTLSQNISWNKFLAQYGLDQARLAEDIRRGRIQDVLALMDQYSALINSSRGGFVLPTNN